MMNSLPMEQLKVMVQQLPIDKRDEFCGLNGIYLDSERCEFVQALRPLTFAGPSCMVYTLGIDWVRYTPAYTDKNGRAKDASWSVVQPNLAAALKRELHLYYINGRFVNGDGNLSEDYVMSVITERLNPFFDIGIAAKAKAIMGVLKATCYAEPPEPNAHAIYLRGSTTIYLDEDANFTPMVQMDALTLNRLRVNYDPAADCPLFKKYLNDLLDQEDQLTVQEFCGYALIPSTKAQKALLLRGDGQEGKSVLLHIMNAIFGESCVVGQMPDLERNRFKLATLENKLLFMDDDLQTALLEQTATIKTIITARTPIQAERKGKDAFTFRPYARILCAGNAFIGSMHDRSDGFYRRLILIECKKRPVNRHDNKSLEDDIIANELPGVLNWMLTGLQLIVRSDYEFHLSAAVQERIKRKKMEDNPTLQFMLDDGWIRYEPGAMAATADIMNAFAIWCKLNAVQPPSPKTATQQIAKSAADHGCVADEHIMCGTARKRGYKGICLTAEAKAQVDGATCLPYISNPFSPHYGFNTHR